MTTAYSLRSIKFTVEKGKKKPKSINEQNTIYVLYAPEKIKINAGDCRYVVMDFAIGLPKDIMRTFLIVLSLRVEGLELTYNTNPECGEKIKFELFNNNRNRKILIKKEEKLALFMTINEELESFQTRYEKF